DLAAEQINAGTLPDGYFRGMTRLLSDLTEDELQSLTAMICALYDLTLHTNQKSVVVRQDQDDVIDCRRTAEGTDTWARIGTIDTAPRLFFLLKIHGLATDLRAGGRFSIGSGPHLMGIQVRVIRRIAELLRPAA